MTVFPKRTFGFKRSELRAIKLHKKLPTTKEQLSEDRQVLTNSSDESSLKKKYKEALKTIENQEKKLDAINSIRNTVETYVIKQSKNSLSSEATAVWMASDWHTDEYVDEGTINNLNHFTPEIAKERVDKFFTSGLRLTNILAQDIKIETIILALLGDFYTGHIHPDFMELTDTEPIHAVIRVQNMIASGIEFILQNSKYNLVVPCHSGNHARTTEKTRFATENGHSLEFYMYNFLADHFKGNSRVKFLIPQGQMSYMEIYGMTVRLMHGHAIRYGGGVGGIYIPVNKAITQWDKAKKADLTLLGHFHTQRDGGNFLVNGSLIGYSSFALSIKADFERPKQTLFLLDSRRGKTAVWPILLA